MWQARAPKFVLITGFLVLIWLPLLGLFLSDQANLSVSEKRKLAQLPSFKLDEAYPEKFTRYFNDNFGFRAPLRAQFNGLKFFIIGSSPSHKVLLGKESWLYYKDEGTYFDYLGLEHFSDKALADWAASLEQKRAMLEEQGIKYLFVIAPNKFSIYPEFSPLYPLPTGLSTRLDQLLNYLEKNTTVEVLDLRKALLGAKERGRLFMKTDTHWTSFGASVAANAVLKRISRMTTQQMQLDDLSSAQLQSTGKGGDLANMMGLRPHLSETEVNLEGWDPSCGLKRDYFTDPKKNGSRLRKPFTTRCPKSGLHALMFRDSFGTLLQHHLSPSLSQISYIWTYPTLKTMRQYVARHQPDIVIEQRIERALINLPSI